MDKCVFDKNGICYAMACYTNKKCSAKDKNGNIRQATVEEINKENKYD